MPFGTIEAKQIIGAVRTAPGAGQITAPIYATITTIPEKKRPVIASTWTGQKESVGVMRNTPRARAAQAPPHNDKRPTVPAASVFDGEDLAGSIIERDGKHLASTNTGKLIGSCASRSAAMRVIPSEVRMQG